MTQLWKITDVQGDSIILEGSGFGGPDDALALLEQPSGNGVWLTSDAARDLRNALNRLLVEDGGAAEDGYGQVTLEGAQALHAAQHRQLQVAAQRSARHIDEQAGILARLADDPDKLNEAVHVLLDVQRRTVASLGDLLAAVAGEP